MAAAAAAAVPSLPSSSSTLCTIESARVLPRRRGRGGRRRRQEGRDGPGGRGTRRTGKSSIRQRDRKADAINGEREREKRTAKRARARRRARNTCVFHAEKVNSSDVARMLDFAVHSKDRQTDMHIHTHANVGLQTDGQTNKHTDWRKVAANGVARPGERGHDVTSVQVQLVWNVLAGMHL